MAGVELWVAFLGLMIITFISRGLFLLIGSKFPIPEGAHEFLRYAPTAALIAIILPEVFFEKNPSSGLYGVNLWSSQLFGGLASIIGFLLTRSLLGTILFGMAVFALAQWLL